MPRPPKYVPVAAAALAPAPDHLYTGTSGWAYTSWKPVFYPQNVPSKAFLHYYGSRFTSVEVNYTFQNTCETEQLHGWIAATPPGFRFSFKAPQRITHFRRLLECDDAIADFVAMLQPMRDAGKLGPILFQLPPSLKLHEPRLLAVLSSPALADPTLQLAFEFRHPSWFTDSVYDILRSRNAALCVAESDDLVTPDIATADFRCYRLRCNGAYSRKQLSVFAQRFTTLAATQPVYAYFKHEDEPTGALNALAMLRCANKLSPANKLSAENKLSPANKLSAENKPRSASKPSARKQPGPSGPPPPAQPPGQD